MHRNQKQLTFKAVHNYALEWWNCYNMSTKKNNATVLTSEQIKNGKTQVKSATHSIFYCVNELNKLAKKNEYCDATAVRPVADVIKTLHEERGYFGLCVFPKDSKGRFYISTVKVSGFEAELPSLLNGEVITDKLGREVVWSEEKKCFFALEYRCTVDSLFSAYCKIAKGVTAEKKATESAEKKAQKDAEKRAKENEKMAAELSRRYMSGEISEQQFNESIAALKAA